MKASIVSLLIVSCITNTIAFTSKPFLTTKTISIPSHPSLSTSTISSLHMSADPSEEEIEIKKETTWDRITGPKLFKVR